MAGRIGGSGMGLQPPQFLYPTQLYNTAPDVGSNRIVLEPGAAWPIQPGDWLLSVGAYSVFQYLDPYTNSWLILDAQRVQPFHHFADGTETRRIANLLGCPVGAVITNGGTSYTQATASITANVGGSTWTPIVGGALSVTSVTAAGANFLVQPLVLIPGPPTYAANGVGGIPAEAYATLTNGTVSGVTLTAIGAGYVAATVTGLIVGSPYDPNIGSITPGTVTFGLTDSGKITGAICTDNGAPLATLTALTLTAAGGAGSGATIAPLVMQTVASTSIVLGGAGWGNATNSAKVFSVGGGNPSTSAIGNSSVELTKFRPRDVNITGTTNAGGTITATTIIDSGLFISAPTSAIIPGGTVPTTAATITFTMGTANDTILAQPL